MAGVNLTDLKKTFPGNVQAVKGVSLEVRDKEFMVLVGPSGCGKTTILRMVSGLEEATEGTIRIGDRMVNDVPPKDRNIAMVFQNYAIYPHMNVYDNMAFGLRQRKFKKAEIDKRVRKAAAILGIDGLLRQRPKALSGGQRQRVAVGRAIVRDPAVFLFDEPLSNLDARMRVDMRRELKLLHRRLQTTIIYVTHDQVEAMTLGDRVCVINNGLIEQTGPPIEVYDRPKTRFVAAFIGTPPMNFLPGTVSRNAAGLVFRGDGFEIAFPEPPPGRNASLAGGNADLGVRPEDLKPAEEGGIPGQVRLVEALGNEKLVYADAGEMSLIARYDSHMAVEPGQRVRWVPNPAKLHLFDRESGRNLLHG